MYDPYDSKGFQVINDDAVFLVLLLSALLCTPGVMKDDLILIESALVIDVVGLFWKRLTLKDVAVETKTLLVFLESKPSLDM